MRHVKRWHRRWDRWTKTKSQRTYTWRAGHAAAQFGQQCGQRGGGFLGGRARRDERVDLEARLGSATGPLIGRGAGSTITGFLENYTPRTLIPAWGGPLTPDNTAASVAEGATVDIYLVIRRIDTVTTFGIQTRKDRASFAVWCDPLQGV